MKSATELFQGWTDAVLSAPDNFVKQQTKARWIAAFGEVEIKRAQPKNLQPPKTPYRRSCALYMVHGATQLYLDSGEAIPKRIRRAVKQQQRLYDISKDASKGSPSKRVREEFIR